jgi:hypothetical protein
MHPTLNRNLYFVKEHVKVFKAANSFDIYDPDTKQIILTGSRRAVRLLHQNVSVYRLQTDDAF